MNNKKRKMKIFTVLLFVVGLIFYLVGLLLLFSSSLSTSSFVKTILFNMTLSRSAINIMKIIGTIFFVVGFILFMIAVIFLYKNDDIKENNRNLIIEGKADVITIIFMTYIMIFMLVICLIADEIIGALLFGITIIIQSLLNSILIKYFSKRR